MTYSIKTLKKDGQLLRK